MTNHPPTTTTKDPQFGEGDHVPLIAGRFFTVLGIVARSGIMLIIHYQHLEQVEGMPFGTESILQGAGERIVPIPTTGLALVPPIVSGEISGQEVESPWRP